MQVGGTSNKEAKKAPTEKLNDETNKINTLESSMERLKDSKNLQHENSHKLRSTQEGSSQFFSVTDWKYVILYPDIESYNQ
jgi:hypothetical protein